MNHKHSGFSATHAHGCSPDLVITRNCTTSKNLNSNITLLDHNQSFLAHSDIGPFSTTLPPHADQSIGPRPSHYLLTPPPSSSLMSLLAPHFPSSFTSNLTSSPVNFISKLYSLIHLFLTHHCIPSFWLTIQTQYNIINQLPFNKVSFRHQKGIDSIFITFWKKTKLQERNQLPEPGGSGRVLTTKKAQRNF